MSGLIKRIGILLILLVSGISGCASIGQLSEETESEVINRTGYEVTWQGNEVDEAARKELIRSMLSDTLGMDDAIRITLLNNRHLQGLYESAGIAQADLMQAGLFENPALDIHIGYPVEEDHAPDLGFSLAMNVLDLFHAPLRKALSGSRLEEVRLQVASGVLAKVTDLKQAYYAHQAAMQKHDMLEQVFESAEAAYEAAGMLREAGNIRALDLNNERSFFEQTRLELAYAQLNVMQTREQLNQVMGVWGEDATLWSVVPRLPASGDLPERIEESEQVAVEMSLDLALAAQKLETFAYQKKVVNATALLPHLKAGADAEREETWEVGPGIGFPVPLFDRGQARKAGIEAQIRQQQATYYGLAVDVRAAVRTLRHQLITQYQVARHYRDVIVPLSSQISTGSQEQYNAMQIGVFRLLDAKRQEIAAGKNYLDALLAYYTSLSEYELLLNGVMRTVDRPVMPSSGSPGMASGFTDLH